MDKDRREIVELSNIGTDQNQELDVGSFVERNLLKAWKGFNVEMFVNDTTSGKGEVGKFR